MCQHLIILNPCAETNRPNGQRESWYEYCYEAQIQIMTNKIYEYSPSIANQLKVQQMEVSQKTDNCSFADQKSAIARYVEPNEEFGEIIRLAYYSSNEEVHIDQQTLYLLQKYSTNQVCFIGFVGSKSSCKNLVIDTVLNLSAVQGSHFTNSNDSSEQVGLYVWSIPYSYNLKLKIFIVQFRGITFTGEPLKRNDQILMDLFMVLSSTVVIVSPQLQQIKKKNRIFDTNQSKQPKIEAFQQQLLGQIYQSQNRILIEGQQTTKVDSYWPNALFYFHNERINQMKIENIQNYFSHGRYIPLQDPFLIDGQSKEILIMSLNDNLRSINPSFVKRVSHSFVDLFQSIACKNYRGLRFTGNVLCKILINTVKYMNKKSNLKIDKIFASIFKQLYQASLVYHQQIYENYLKQVFKNEQPFTYDNLLNTFSLTSNHVLTSFNEVVINQTFHQQYESKLLAFIQQKQVLIIDINFNKTHQILDNRLKKVNDVTNFCEINGIKHYISKLFSISDEYDHNTTNFFSKNLLKYTNNLENRIIAQKQKIERQRINVLEQRYSELQQKFFESKEANNKIKKQNQQNLKSNRMMIKELAQLQSKLKGVKKEIDNQKRYQKQFIILKQSQKDAAEGLLQTLRELEQKSRDNTRQMNQINKQFQYHPDILTLNKKLEEKEREIREIQKLESRIDIQSRTSILRSAVQKPKQSIEKRPIKKVTTKR